MNPHPKPPKRIKLKPEPYKALCDQIWKRDRGICQICFRFTVCPEYHHTIFRSQGGGDTIDNMLILCNTCHHKIHAGNHGSAEYRQKAVDRMGEINGKTI